MKREEEGGLESSALESLDDGERRRSGKSTDEKGGDGAVGVAERREGESVTREGRGEGENAPRPPNCGTGEEGLDNSEEEEDNGRDGDRDPEGVAGEGDEEVGLRRRKMDSK
jgi:hypothetical protein